MGVNQPGNEIATVNTDSSGRASTAIWFGPNTGLAKVAISAAGITSADTLRFTIVPGAAATIRLSVQDTILVVGSSATQTSVVTDQSTNVRAFDVVSYSVDDPTVVTVVGSDLRASSFGETTVVASADRARASFRVAVVPQGTLAAFHQPSGQIVLVELDGSGRRAIAPATVAVGGLGLVWAPSGDRLYVSKAAPISHRLFELMLDGSDRPITPAPGTLVTNALWPSVTEDGATIYFAGEPPNGSFDVWRVRPDGTGIVNLHLAGSGELGYAPYVSPDGQQVVYGTTLAGGSTLVIRRLTDGLQVGSLGSGTLPSWSPRGGLIAFVDPRDKHLAVGTPSGTVIRTLAPAQLFASTPVAWSSNGEYLVAVGQVLTIVEVATGRWFPLRWAEQMDSPAWRPSRP